MYASCKCNAHVLSKHDKSKMEGENPFPPDRAKGDLSHLHRHLLATGIAFLLIAVTADL